MHPREQTIFALSSGRPPSAIAIVRVSGPEAATALTLLAGKIPLPRMATRALLRDGHQQPIDDAVVRLWTASATERTSQNFTSTRSAALAALFAMLGARPYACGGAGRIHLTGSRTASLISPRPRV
jgi:tRNA modification GTPase